MLEILQKRSIPMFTTPMMYGTKLKKGLAEV